MSAPIRRAVLHLGGNGHASCRLDRARAALGRRCPALELVDVPYPGFEGRPGVGSFDDFLQHLTGFVRDLPDRPVGGYASGIGALIALGLRARGGLAGIPLIFQGPVLWGLEGRWFPRAMRIFPPARGLLRSAFALPAFRRRFARRQFVQGHDASALGPFFEGYRQCSAFGDLFDWLTPGLLRSMERAFEHDRAALGGITAWVGGRDRVVGIDEVRTTGRTLGVGWPVVEFEGWGHYPMIDVPEEWADALCRALAPA